MCALLRYSAGGLAVLFTTAYVAASAEIGIGAFRPTVIEPAPAANTVVNRTNKGDRAVTVRDARETVVPQAPATAVQNKPATATKEQKILEGCDPAFSPLTSSARSNFAGRCLV
jgi:hypothetical protein